jgi:hypothetical protein
MQRWQAGLQTCLSTNCGRQQAVDLAAPDITLLPLRLHTLLPPSPPPTRLQVRTTLNVSRTKNRHVFATDGFNYSTTRMMNKYLEGKTQMLYPEGESVSGPGSGCQWARQSLTLALTTWGKRGRHRCCTRRVSH